MLSRVAKELHHLLSASDEAIACKGTCRVAL